jgi:hypothetical protein
MGVHDGGNPRERWCAQFTKQVVNIGRDLIQVIVGVHFSEVGGLDITPPKARFREYYLVHATAAPARLK